jgi:hypothetical protein
MTRSHAGSWGLLAGLAFVTGVVVACGGGSSSTSGPSRGGGFGGSSGAVIQGQLVRTRSAALGESPLVIVVRTALGIGLAEAAPGDPVSGAEVKLTETTTLTTFTTTTNSQGNFIFTNIPGGTYTIQVTDPTATPPTTLTLDVTSDGGVGNEVVVGAGDVATISGQVAQTAADGTVHVAASDVGDVLQNSAQLCHAMSIASASGANLGDVINTRQAGHGWGNVARQFQVPPRVLGNNQCTEAEIADASATVAPRTGPANNTGGNGKGKGKGKKKGQS